MLQLLALHRSANVSQILMLRCHWLPTAATAAAAAAGCSNLSYVLGSLCLSPALVSHDTSACMVFATLHL
jgi:hypothetical protein